MKIMVNGETRELEREVSLAEMLKILHLPTDRVAVELNLGVVRKKDWDDVTVTDSDRIEIVHFVGGG